MSVKLQWDSLIPLSEINADYEPEMQQILEYAEFIGLSLPEDNKYLHIAREGLKANLPAFWQACEGEDGEMYFRNKKTRVISSLNPLDQLYRQKVKQLKQLQAQTNIYSINEESSINQSSGMYRSRSKANDIRKSQRQNLNISQINPILEMHITEESFQLQNPSAEKEQRRIFQPKPAPRIIVEPQWKIKQRLQIEQLKARIQRMIPQRNQIITNIDVIGDHSKLQRIMNIKNMQNLISLRLKVQQKRAKLQQCKRQKKQLQQTLDNMIQTK